MRLTSLAVTLLSFPSLLHGHPTPHTHDIPFPDDMPNPTPAQLRAIEERAHGTLPNTPPPDKISDQGIVNLQLIAFNELFEVAFFHELLINVTGNVEGFEFSSLGDRDIVINALTAILAQEELHAISANNALQHFNVTPIKPCQYNFPVEDFDSAIILAVTFTDLVLGTLQDVVERFAVGGDFNLTRLISSVIGQEGEQLGWYRILQNKIPSELPFLTTSDLNFAFTAVQSFTVPGSCPSLSEIPLQTFQPLEVVTPPGPASQNLQFAWKPIQGAPPQTLWMTYINQLNIPIVVPLHIIFRNSERVLAEAFFPFTENLMNGLTIAAVTNSSGPFPNANAVAKATVFGPGLLIVN
ncbi:hypothetical protein ASPWEDRAFT_170576 [Aspergillus wentii DTO 134E9]|uniref:Late sexual development protein n=1 Tax=Aspergillus wentii DTO 134E9 TaxID=1073089 RepID=A0A1L9RQ79_ASPWE|nr:uncharacterized protein ASPWEDRAFT_170576 [Aspergillus wentii DTO 134E9]KAI9928426.1 hypothetical protein MW887_002470 [Aspergillus wentii]OJJ37084.1 hypothetical protein ASPWEDRAFT_170576 [Aspergillus wentii DTO 134E9]